MPLIVNKNIIQLSASNAQSVFDITELAKYFDNKRLIALLCCIDKHSHLHGERLSTAHSIRMDFYVFSVNLGSRMMKIN